MLYGIGLGPGDPELLTLKAVRILKESIKVFVPGEMAAELVRPYVSEEPEILDFPMIHDEQKLKEIWTANAEHVADYSRKGDVAFCLIGDPNFFSTFTHMKKVMADVAPDVEVETVPGISSITSCAARMGTAVETSFEVHDGVSDINYLIHLKARRPQEIIARFEKEGYKEFIFAERLFSDKEIIIEGKENIPEEGNYFSIVYGKK
ncbi:MAG: cobalt-factor II C(20)-methyltransferase [Methanosarcinales archaeon]|jgi:precorrin-2/cobalt-factor-2 C20-methyltransferase|nr:cobalt-factor II C(20)-methyltransferase [Methanosarcinales archaeon]